MHIYGINMHMVQNRDTLLISTTFVNYCVMNVHHIYEVQPINFSKYSQILSFFIFSVAALCKCTYILIQYIMVLRVLNIVQAHSLSTFVGLMTGREGGR